MRPERVGGVAPTVQMAGGGGARPSLWRTPTPYLFLGFAVMMGLIVVALLVLICTRRKASSSSADDEKAASVRGVLVPLDREPRVVVIMAGDALPSFIAVASAMKPLAFAAPAGAEAV
ncbi:protein GLUTAMINE DUMPER 5-like [Miscanthus floridulus]|uniref:protein GLUTAMINE DUMPER 5-like n=1 Tax=Miscanthus floridulus TaxID=154761 RepID=UPI0034581142